MILNVVGGCDSEYCVSAPLTTTFLQHGSCFWQTQPAKPNGLSKRIDFKNGKFKISES